MAAGSSLQTLQCRSRISAAATGPSSPRPRPRPRTAASSGPFGGSVEGVKGACEVLGQAVVGWAVGGRAGGPRVSPGRVAGGRLFSQTASELLVAALSVRFPAKVQLRGAGVLIRPGPPLTPPQIHQVGPELGQDWGEVGSEGVPTGSAQTPGQRQLRRGPGPCQGPKPQPHPAGLQGHGSPHLTSFTLSLQSHSPAPSRGALQGQGLTHSRVLGWGPTDSSLLPQRKASRRRLGQG